MLFSPAVVPLITNVEVLYDVIVSDHKPLAFCLECEAKLACELAANVGECTRVLVSQWHLCDDLFLQRNRDTVDHNLSNISIANMLQTARCSDVANRMIDKAYDFIVNFIKKHF